MGMVMVEFVDFTVTFPVVTGNVTVVGDTTLSDEMHPKSFLTTAKTDV